MANTPQEFQDNRDIFTLTNFKLNLKKKLFENEFLDIDNGTVFFINLDNKQEYKKYIQDNISTLTSTL